MNNSGSGTRVLSFLDSATWAMDPSAYLSMREVVLRWAQLPGAPAPLSREDKDAAIAAAQAARPMPAPSSSSSSSSIALLSLYGVISPRAGMLDDISGGCGMDAFSRAYQSAMADSNVGGVIVAIDSPGGNVYQVPETADMIRSLRATKPNVGVVTGMCASAALWLGTQFAELVGSPSSELGSIGILTTHKDVSKAAEAEGVKVTIITSPQGGYKAEGNPFAPLSSDAAEFMQSRTDEFYSMFIDALRAGRGVHGNYSIDKNWGRGRLLSAAKAVELGMADRVGTLQDEIANMAAAIARGGNAGGKGARAEDGAPTPTAAEVGDDAARRARLRLLAS